MMNQSNLSLVRKTMTDRKCAVRRHRSAGLSPLRGVTLIEILIVLAIIGLISGGIALVAVPKYKEAQITTAKNDTKALYTIGENWRANHAADCPTVDRLKADKEISATSNIIDPWGMAYKISCEDSDNLQVISFGPDKKENTTDDIKMPPEGSK